MTIGGFLCSTRPIAPARANIAMCGRCAIFRAIRPSWLLALAFALQEAEEWNIVADYQTWFPGAPAVSSAHLRATLCAAALVGWLWTLAAMHARSAQRAAFWILPFAGAMFLEALPHAFWTVRVRGYVPGMVMSLAVLGPASLLLARLAWRDGLVSRFYLRSLVRDRWRLRGRANSRGRRDLE